MPLTNRPHSWDAPAPHSNLSELELAWSNPIGPDADVAPLRPDSSVSPRAALEQIVLTALLHPPCLVSFSGGRDSSVILAIATHVARREGLPLPIPVTHRFPEVSDSAEDAWQELMVWHLDLSDWQILRWTSDLDNLGPYAQRTLRTIGVTAPCNQHFLLPIIDLAAGGSLLTGSDGDEIFELRSRPIATRFLYGPDRWALRDLRGFLPGLLPLRVRAYAARSEHALDYPWLRPLPLRDLNMRLWRWLQGVPLQYDRALMEWFWQSRTTQGFRQQTAQLGAVHDTEVEHPFSAPTFISAFAAAVGPAGPLGRARGLREIAGDLLPSELFSRVTKASFEGAFSTSYTRAFAERWDGSSFDPELIDAEALVNEWRKPHPEPHSLCLLQAAWLAEAELSKNYPERCVDGSDIPRTGQHEGGDRH